jgi:hypothetical protein
MQEVASYFVYQLVNELALFNLNECVYFGWQVIGEHFPRVFTEAFDGHFWNATLQLFYMSHKAPSALRSCILLNTTLTDLNNTKNNILFKDWKKSAIALGTNLLFNMADIYTESVNLVQGVRDSRWDDVGRNLAKLLTDIVVKNPLDESWNFLNSESIGYRL